MSRIASEDDMAVSRRLRVIEVQAAALKAQVDALSIQVATLETINPQILQTIAMLRATIDDMNTILEIERPLVSPASND